MHPLDIGGCDIGLVFVGLGSLMAEVSQEIVFTGVGLEMAMAISVPGRAFSWALT